MKRLFAIFIFVCLSICTLQVYAEQSSIKVTVNDQQVRFDIPPFSEHGRILVPVRAIFEQLGANIDWNSNLRTVTATKENKQIKIKLDSNKAYVNNNEILMDVPAKELGSRVFVPVRFISESLGCSVGWDSAAKTVKITTTISTDYNLVLDQDKTMDSLKLHSGKIDLKGFTLTVLGDLIQEGGTIEIDNGILEIKGNYKIETENGGVSTGILKMINDNDCVKVHGNFIMHSSQSHTPYLTNGILEVKGNFTQKNGGSKTCFDANSNHKTILDGDDIQNVTFESVGSSKFNLLEINKPIQLYNFNPPVK